jgi:hypothetical protein
MLGLRAFAAAAAAFLVTVSAASGAEAVDYDLVPSDGTACAGFGVGITVGGGKQQVEEFRDENGDRLSPVMDADG